MRKVLLIIALASTPVFAGFRTDYLTVTGSITFGPGTLRQTNSNDLTTNDVISADGSTLSLFDQSNSISKTFSVNDSLWTLGGDLTCGALSGTSGGFSSGLTIDENSGISPLVVSVNSAQAVQIESSGNMQVSRNLDVNGATSGSVPLTIESRAAQTANLLQMKNSAGVVISSFSNSGGLTVPSINTIGSGTFISTSIIDVPLRVSRIASQTGNLLEFKDENGIVRSYINNVGGLGFHSFFGTDWYLGPNPSNVTQWMFYNPDGFSGGFTVGEPFIMTTGAANSVALSMGDIFGNFDGFNVSNENVTNATKSRFFVSQSNGHVGLNNSAANPNAQLDIVIASATVPGLNIIGAASQTAPLIQLKGNSSTSVRELVDLDATFSDSTDATRKGRFIGRVRDFNGVKEFMRADTDGTNPYSAFIGSVTFQGPLISTAVFYTTTSSRPWVSSCGTTPSIASYSTNQSGQITVGGGVTSSCTLNFGTPAWINPPACIFTSNAAVASGTGTSTASAFTFGGTSITSDIVMYICQGSY